jgi:2-C-methyl-D-erythritol 4-phosphate cytidylyltransferase
MIAAVIVAGGKGLRMGQPLPKQFIDLRNTPILTRTLQVFDRCGIIDKAVVVLPGASTEYYKASILTAANLQGEWAIATGGRRRQDSVMNGLAAIEGDHGVVLIHDGVRPLVTAALIKAVALGAQKWGACIPTLPAIDTLKRVDENGKVIETPLRNMYRMAQTPQGFRLDIIKAAHSKAIEEGLTATDDASLVESIGQTVRVIEGERMNIKITTPEDLAVARAYLSLRSDSISAG